jgi:hypothetical protein
VHRVTVHKNDRPRSGIDNWHVVVTEGCRVTRSHFRTEDEAKDFALITLARRQMVERYLETKARGGTA